MTTPDYTAEDIEDIIESIVAECLEIAAKSVGASKVAMQTVVIMLKRYEANTPEIRKAVMDALKAERVALVDSAAGYGGSGRLNLK